jgi:hypothetical protein
MVMSNYRRAAVVIGSCATALTAACPAGAAWTAPQELPNTAGRYPAFAAYGAGGVASVGLYGPLTLVPGVRSLPTAARSSPAGRRPRSHRTRRRCA